ncbi:MAG: hypothetical protein ABW275_06330, partial [Hansschlegelia sp.]
PDLSRWPEAAAGEGFTLLARSPEARALHRDARRLAELVAEAARAEAPNGFAFRVVGEVAARRSDRLSWLTASPGRFSLAGVSFCVAALALGAALGAAVAPAQAGASAPDLGAAVEVALLDGDL